MKTKPTIKANKRREARAGNADKGNTKGDKFRVKAKQLIAPAHIMEFIERISDGFVAFDAQMNYTYVNRRGGELLGRKPQELIGKNYWEEYPEARGTPFANAYVRAGISNADPNGGLLRPLGSLVREPHLPVE